jgi:hypothetical protein
MGPAQPATTPNTPAATMSTSSSTITSSTPLPVAPIEKLPANIPRLEVNGANWAIFSMRFREAMQATRRWGYFDGSRPRPTPKDPSAPSADEQEELERWEYQDLVARYLLSQRLPDTTAMRLSSYTTAQMRWARVNEEFTAKSVYAQNDLEQAFFEMRCPKDGDVRTFLTSVRYKREELAAAGVRVTNRDYQRTVLRGIPEDLAKFASQLLAAARLTRQQSVVDTDTLIDHICEEAERLKNRRARGQNKGAGKKDGEDEALAATGSEGGKKRRKGKCHNCDKPGHWARECRSPKKDKDENAATSTTSASTSNAKAKPENKPVGSANAVTTYDYEGDGFWMAEEVVDHAQLVSADPDPLLQEGEDLDEGSEAYFSWSGPADWACENEPGHWLGEEGELAGAIITSAEEDRDTRVELYDSGATRHISPYKDDFTDYAPLSPPVLLNTANQQRFQAIGLGSLPIRVPSGDEDSELILRDVLHAPSVAYTLVSLGALDAEGYRMTIADGALAMLEIF